MTKPLQERRLGRQQFSHLISWRLTIRSYNATFKSKHKNVQFVFPLRRKDETGLIAICAEIGICEEEETSTTLCNKTLCFFIVA